jgi:hypothetical protein
MYSALLESIAEDLPEPTRRPANWAALNEFGLPSSTETDKYLVSFDIAACYEYVSHPLLRTELILHTMNVVTVDSLMSLLDETFGRPMGLPQMMTTSDVLADAYLDAMERALVRKGHRLIRYADDFKVLAADWATANAVIEDASNIARQFGLVLSSEKTNIRRAETLQTEREEVATFIQKYFQSAQEDLVDLDYVLGDYGELEEVEIAPDDDEALREAHKRVLNDWLDLPSDETHIHQKLVGRALRSLQDDPDRLSDTVLGQIVYREPIRVELVCQYILARAEIASNWESLRILVEIKRQPPWTKLWLLHTAGSLVSAGGQAEGTVRDWALTQMGDKYESVRAQAAWYHASHSKLSQGEVARLFQDASSITRPAIAAALGRQGEEPGSALARAIAGDSVLSAKAFAWGAAN